MECRNGTIVQIYQNRANDGKWVETGDPIDLSQQGFAQTYYQEIKLGILATMGTVSNVLVGTCAPV
jgi:hypothetical protein